ncbi:hypothetical protein M3Y97_00141400 [Aphelenchoides bicaudatus]|nr:hypothetical protein M3Y97_00141400 [Aphelenchoides bicaudatus]
MLTTPFIACQSALINLLLIRAIGVGNFCERNSDSSLQLAVLENMHSALGKPSCFYQELRCTDAETHYLQSKEINVIQADSLNEVPTQIADLIKDSSRCFCLVFMVHFDHLGFERVLKSFESLNTDHRIIFIGNELPIDYNGELQKKLSNFKIEPVPLPPKPAQNIGNQQDRSSMWWRKAFANTCIYVQNDNYNS